MSVFILVSNGDIQRSNRIPNRQFFDLRRDFGLYFGGFLAAGLVPEAWKWPRHAWGSILKSWRPFWTHFGPFLMIWGRTDFLRLEHCAVGTVETSDMLRLGRSVFGADRSLFGADSSLLGEDSSLFGEDKSLFGENICPVSAADICPVSTADTCPVSAADICPVSTHNVDVSEVSIVAISQCSSLR